MSGNSHAIRSLYASFAAGDIPGVLELMDEAIVWREAENFTYADGNPYVGHQAVVEGVFARCGSEWEGFGAHPDAIHAAGDTIIATGRYSGTWLATGTAMSPQFVHVWTLRDGKAIAFQQYVDTLAVARATGAV